MRTTQHCLYLRDETDVLQAGDLTHNYHPPRMEADTLVKTLGQSTLVSACVIFSVQGDRLAARLPRRTCSVALRTVRPKGSTYVRSAERAGHRRPGAGLANRGEAEPGSPKTASHQVSTGADTSSEAERPTR